MGLPDYVRRRNCFSFGETFHTLFNSCLEEKRNFLFNYYLQIGEIKACNGFYPQGGGENNVPSGGGIEKKMLKKRNV